MELASRQRLAEALIPIVRKAGTVVCSLQNGRLSQYIKADGSPVTSADLASHDILYAGCRALQTGFPVLSEEGEGAAAKLFGSTVFVIDPLDGTKEFIAGRDEFTINLALVEDGHPTIGLIYAPARKRLFFSYGHGYAFEEDDGEYRRSLVDNPVAVRRPIIVASRSHLDQSTQDLLAALPPCTVQRLGSALKFALVATGQADAYIRLSPMMIWDCVAGQALVEATGGFVLRSDGSLLQEGRHAALRIDSVIAARTPQLAAQIIDAARLTLRPRGGN